MKYLLLLLILTLSTLFSASLTLDKQIAQLKDADPKERFTLMNALKLRIATMNASERSSAITQLKTQMHQKNISHQNDSRQKHQEMLASDQMQQIHKQKRAQDSYSGGKNPNRPGGGSGHKKPNRR